mgnify:CR=1 FL=1
MANYSFALDAYDYLKQFFSKSQIFILMYHRVTPIRDSWTLESLSPLNFERQIIYLQRHYKIISLEHLVESMAKGICLPKKTAVITFDDGYKDNYYYAYPILKNYCIPATFFLSTGHIGTGNLFWWDKIGYAIQHTDLDQLDLDGIGAHSLRSADERKMAILRITERLKKVPSEKMNSLLKDLLAIACPEIPIDLGKKLIMSWDDVREMSCDGFAFGAHTANHPILTNMPLEQVEFEILQSKKDIEEKIGQKVTAFSYPGGCFDEDIVGLVQKSSFKCAVDGGRNRRVNPTDNVYRLARIATVENFNISKVILSGLMSDLYSGKCRIKAIGDRYGSS